MSLRARDEYDAFAKAHPEVPTLWLDVIAQRALSQAVARATRVHHESPQALLYENGHVVWNTSHGEITAAALAAALER